MNEDYKIFVGDHIVGLGNPILIITHNYISQELDENSEYFVHLSGKPSEVIFKRIRGNLSKYQNLIEKQGSEDSTMQPIIAFAKKAMYSLLEKYINENQYGHLYDIQLNEVDMSMIINKLIASDLDSRFIIEVHQKTENQELRKSLDFALRMKTEFNWS